MTTRSARNRDIPIVGQDSSEPEENGPVESQGAVNIQDLRRGRARGRGRSASQVVREPPLLPKSRTRGRGRGRGRGRRRSAGIPERQEVYVKESSTGGRGRSRGRGRRGVANQAFVTQETFANEMGEVQTALQTLLTHHQNSNLSSREISEGVEVYSLPKTEVGGHSQLTPVVTTDTKQIEGCSFKTFASCKPPTHKRERDPVLALKLLREMEMAFDTSNCASKDKVKYALSMLKEDALYWWDVESAKEGEGAARKMYWESFASRFKAQFFPLAAVKKFEEEFLKLEQGSMTVQEYTFKVIEKSRFALKYVPTEECRVERYIWGLRSNIRELVTTRNPTTFQAAVDAAEMTE